MDPVIARRREARTRQLERRRRLGRLRGRSFALSALAFAAMWVIVFAQMAAGRDPVLGSGTPSSSATASKNSRKQPAASRRPHTRLAVDPLTGMIVRVPVGRNAARTGAATTPAPSLPPVTTSQS